MKGESCKVDVQELLDFREVTTYLGLDGYLTRVLEEIFFQVGQEKRESFLECLKRRGCTSTGLSTGSVQLYGDEYVDRTLTWVFNRRNLLQARAKRLKRNGKKERDNKRGVH